MIYIAREFSFADHIPEGYVSDTKVIGNVKVTIWRNPTADPVVRQKHLDEFATMLYEFQRPYLEKHSTWQTAINDCNERGVQYFV